MDKMNFLKIIYFDESFVADFLQIIAGGELKKTTEFITEVSIGLEGKTEADVKVSTEKKGLPKIFSFLSGISISANAEGDAEMSQKEIELLRIFWKIHCLQILFRFSNQTHVEERIRDVRELKFSRILRFVPK